MYGTIARMHLKPSMNDQMQMQMKEYETLGIPGFVSTTMYRMDADSDECYLAVVFNDKETYLANAQNPAQDARYRKMRELLASDPEWHDGEVIFHS